MPPSNRAALASLVHQEFRRLSSDPAPQPPAATFRSKRIALSKFDSGWDGRRGNAIRLAAVLLNHDDSQLQDRICGDAGGTEAYRSAITWLSREAAHLRKCQQMHETAVARLRAIIARCAPVTNSSPLAQS